METPIVLSFNEGFSLFHLMQSTNSICTPETKIYSSSMFLDYTIDQISKGEVKDFEPIIAFHDETYSIIAQWSMLQNEKAIDLQGLVNFFNRLDAKSQNVLIEFDVEDGYRYDNYKHIILTNQYIVLA
jgi:hypothetical protein